MDRFRNLVEGCRSFRRFEESAGIPRDLLADLVDLSRFAPSSGNLQPMKFMISWTAQRNELIFPCLKWAGHLPNWDGPQPGERPTGYVLVMTDESMIKNSNVDVGICAQTIMLGANAAGLGGCMIASIDYDRLREALRIPAHLRVRLVLALGKPAETVIVEEILKGGTHHYWRDAGGVHHVPKRKLEDVLVEPGSEGDPIDGRR